MVATSRNISAWRLQAVSQFGCLEAVALRVKMRRPRVPVVGAARCLGSARKASRLECAGVLALRFETLRSSAILGVSFFAPVFSSLAQTGKMTLGGERGDNYKDSNISGLEERNQDYTHFRSSLSIASTTTNHDRAPARGYNTSA